MGQIAFHNPVTPLFSVLAAWLSSHSSHVSSQVQEHVYSKGRHKQQQPAFVLLIVAPGSKKEHGFFRFSRHQNTENNYKEAPGWQTLVSWESMAKMSWLRCPKA